MHRNTLGIWILFRSRITTDTFCPSAGSFSFRSFHCSSYSPHASSPTSISGKRNIKWSYWTRSCKTIMTDYTRNFVISPDSLWTSMLDSYISKHVNKELRVTVVDLHGNVLFDSSQNDSHELDNHIKRPEVQKALKDGKGYDLRRISETTGKTYFYSATAYEGCIIRSALPYNVNLMNNLAADPHYIWFTVIVSLLLISVFYKFTSKTGQRHQPPARVCQKSRQERTYRHGHTSRLSAQ